MHKIGGCRLYIHVFSCNCYCIETRCAMETTENKRNLAVFVAANWKEMLSEKTMHASGEKDMVTTHNCMVDMQL